MCPKDRKGVIPTHVFIQQYKDKTTITLNDIMKIEFLNPVYKKRNCI